MPCSRQICFVSRMFCIETGWPPCELLVTVIMHSGMFAAPVLAMYSRSAAVFMFPLKSASTSGSIPSAVGRSSASAPENSILARVVSKWALLGMCLPWPPTIENRIRSAARPWWVGMMCLKPVSSRILSWKRKKLRAPA